MIKMVIKIGEIKIGEIKTLKEGIECRNILAEKLEIEKTEINTAIQAIKNKIMDTCEYVYKVTHNEENNQIAFIVVFKRGVYVPHGEINRIIERVDSSNVTIWSTDDDMRLKIYV